MKILRHSGYGFQIKTGRPPSSRSSGIKGVMAHTFNLGYTSVADNIRTLEEGSLALALAPSPACRVGLSNC